MHNLDEKTPGWEVSSRITGITFIASGRVPMIDKTLIMLHPSIPCYVSKRFRDANSFTTLQATSEWKRGNCLLDTGSAILRNSSDEGFEDA